MAASLRPAAKIFPTIRANTTRQPCLITPACFKRSISILDRSRRIDPNNIAPRIAASNKQDYQNVFTRVGSQRHVAPYSGSTKQPARADDYIEELQDLYDNAQDELEIASESTANATIYGSSDRATLREAFDDLDRAYAKYTGTPAQTTAETTANAVTDVESSGEALGGGEAEVGRATARDPEEITDEIREEIKRRVGHRLREMRNAVEALEESAKEE